MSEDQGNQTLPPFAREEVWVEYYHVSKKVAEIQARAGVEPQVQGRKQLEIAKTDQQFQANLEIAHLWRSFVARCPE